MNQPWTAADEAAFVNLQARRQRILDARWERLVRVTAEIKVSASLTPKGLAEILASNATELISALEPFAHAQAVVKPPETGCDPAYLASAEEYAKSCIENNLRMTRDSLYWVLAKAYDRLSDSEIDGILDRVL